MFVLLSDSFILIAFRGPAIVSSNGVLWLMYLSYSYAMRIRTSVFCHFISGNMTALAISSRSDMF